ncbi:MAG: sigma-70 family RNA polymerase sigma factor [Deltaproteobacteria bacterium]|nr:sigma-70 family RNA polymerase sigma factor [Deltaproteobacteria bacterium]
MADKQVEADQELLDAARKGDRKALDRLLEKYQGHVWRFGMKMCGDPEDAKEILQETLIQVTRGLKDFRGASSLTTWLYTIARSFCIKRRRKSKFAPDREESLEAEAEVRAIPDASRGPDEALAGRQLEQVLDEAIRSLEPMYREVLVLRDAEGLSAPEVAEVLGISVEAVKSRLHRARVAVRERVAPKLGIGEAQPAPTCPDVVSLLSRHLEGEIDPDACKEMERHLAVCPGCKGACDSLKQTLALCRTAPPRVPAKTQEAVRKAIEQFLAVSPPS